MKSHKSMKYIYTTLIIIFSNISISQETAYETDLFENYISGQGANESLALASQIICYMANIGTETLANAGNYKAIIYEDDCTTTSSTGSTSAPSATSGQSASSGTSSSNSNNSQSKDADEMLVNTTLAAAGDIQRVKSWLLMEEPYDNNYFIPNYVLYINQDITSGVSATSKFGEFELKAQGLTKNNPIEKIPSFFDEAYRQMLATDGTEVAHVLLKASGSQVQFKNNSQDGEDNLVASFATNGDVTGVYTQWTGLYDASTDTSTDFYGVFGFSKSSSSKVYCTKLTELYKIDSWEYDETTHLPKMTIYTPSGTQLTELQNQGWDTNKICYSTDVNKALRNVWQYGVYNNDGSRFELPNSAIPLRTEVTYTQGGAEFTENAYGYASYWGIWLDDYYSQYFTSDQKWTPDTGNESDENTEYTIGTKDIIVEKIEKSFLALNDIDGLTLGLYVADDWWSDEYKNLGFSNVTESTDRIKFKTNKAVLTDYIDGNASSAKSYSMFGVHDGQNLYDFDLVGAKLDKENLISLLDNNNTGKGLKFSFEIGNVPDGWVDYFLGGINLWICTGTSIAWTGSSGQSNPSLASGQDCLKVEVQNAKINTTSGSNREIYLTNGDRMLAELWESNGNVLSKEFTNNLPEVLTITNSGPGSDDVAALDLKISTILSQYCTIDYYGTTMRICNGLKAFINSSSNFTFFAAIEGLNLFDFESNRFNKIQGTFGIDSSPPTVVFMDDYYVDENTVTTSENLNINLSGALASNVSLDYTISSSSTGTNGTDISTITDGTITIPAGQTFASISFSVTDDTVAESQEKIIIDFSNLSTSESNVVLARNQANIIITDDDSSTEAFDEYLCKYTSSNTTFTCDKGVKFDPYYERKDVAPIVFTTSDWVTKMKKVYEAGTQWEETEIKEMGVWSNDTNQYYVISANSFNNPTSNSTTNGIITESVSRVQIGDLPSELFCIQRCPLAASVASHYTDAKSQKGSAGTTPTSSASPNPHADVGPYIKNNVTQSITYDAGTEYEWTENRTYTRGEYFDGIIASDVVKYTKSGSEVLDPNSNALKLGVDFSSYGAYPGELLNDVYYQNPEGWSEYTGWEVRSGTLVDATNLAKLECEKSDKDGSYVNSHPEYTSANGKISETRYCTQNFNDPTISTSYSIQIRTNSEYNLIDSSSNIVTFNPPTVLYFEVPDDATTYGDDAGKRLSLEYQGFGQLYGIPGHIVDITKASDDPARIIGEYLEGNASWSENYRYINRIAIPNGSVLTDAATGSTYKTKALFGEEWLSIESSALGTLTYSLGRDDLLTNLDMDFTTGPIVYEECRYDEDTDTYYINEETGKCTELAQVTLPDGRSIPATWPNCYEYLSGTDSPFTEEQKTESDYTESLNRCKYVGDMPTNSDLINNGEPSVIHGKVVYNPAS